MLAHVLKAPMQKPVLVLPGIFISTVSARNLIVAAVRALSIVTLMTNDAVIAAPMRKVAHVHKDFVIPNNARLMSEKTVLLSQHIIGRDTDVSLRIKAFHVIRRKKHGDAQIPSTEIAVPALHSVNVKPALAIRPFVKLLMVNMHQLFSGAVAR